jgi:DNA-binding LytR/AlgR family response regulator
MAVETKKLRVIICDDNEADILALKKIIKESVDIIGEASDANECLDVMDKVEADLILLDIDMPGMNGMQLADIIMDFDNPPMIAFITGREDYAVKAFDLAAVDYVVKPFDLDRIEKTLEKASELINNSKKSDLEDTLRKIINDQNKRSIDRLPVKDYKERTIRFVDPAKIVFAQRDSRKVNIYTENEVFPTYYTVDKLEERLKDHGFQKANSGLLINIDFIEHMIPNGDGSYDLLLKVHKDKMVTVSRSCSKAILSGLSV